MSRNQTSTDRLLNVARSTSEIKILFSFGLTQKIKKDGMSMLKKITQLKEGNGQFSKG